MFLTPWEEYLEGKQLPQIRELCESASAMIDSFCYNYKFVGDKPRILIDATASVSAKAYLDKDIILSHGFFDWLDKLIESLPEQITDEITKKNATLMMICWVVAHEFFHISRGHFKIAQTYPNHKDAFEYDADMLATVGVYRHTHHIVAKDNANLTPILSKKHFLLSVFFYLRQLIETKEPDYEVEHKPFHIRLLWIIEKLAWVNNFDEKTRVPTSEFNSEISIFLDSLIDAERTFLRHTNKDKSRLVEFFADLSNNYQKPAALVIAKWEQIESLVNEYQSLEALKRNS